MKDNVVRGPWTTANLTAPASEIPVRVGDQLSPPIPPRVRCLIRLIVLGLIVNAISLAVWIIRAFQ